MLSAPVSAPAGPRTGAGESPGGAEPGWSRRRLRAGLLAGGLGEFPLSALGPESHCSPSRPTDESGDEESVSQTDKTELQNTLRTLSSKVEDLSTCNDLIAKHGTALQRSLSELEALRLPAESSEKIKQVNERATLFRITSNAMINVSALRERPLRHVPGKGRAPLPHPMLEGCDWQSVDHRSCLLVQGI